MLARVVFPDWDTISALAEQARKFLRGDLRRGGISEAQLSLANGIFNHYEIEKRKNGPPDEKKDAEFEEGEAVIPSQMRRCGASLSGLGAFLKPGQDMENGAEKIPP